MKKYNYVVSALMIALSAYILYECNTYGIGTSAQKNPAVWPIFLAIMLIILSIALIIETLLKKETKEEKTAIIIDWKSSGMKKVYIMFGLTVIFLVIMKIFGMLVALLLLIPAIEWLMGCRNKIMLVALPIGLVAFVYVFFVVIMKITLPEPIWM